MTFNDPASREAEAVAEMAATRFGRAIAALLVGGFLALLAIGPALELVAAAQGRSSIFAPLELDHSRPLLGRAMGLIDEIESRFDERSRLVALLRPPTQLVLTGLLAYGNERAVVASGGWLYFRHDLDHVLGVRPPAGAGGDPVAALVDFRDQLARRGIVLLVVPVPVKPAIETGALGVDPARAPLRRPGEGALLARLGAAGVGVLDLAPRFARDVQLGPLYLEADTHWRPEAVEIAAREIALRLRADVELPPGDASRFEEETVALAGEGDIVRMLDLPSDQTLFTPQRVELRRVTTRPGATDRAPVLLLGDSFSEIYAGSLWGSGAGLADRLAFQLGLPVDRISELAGGASASRRKLAGELARSPLRLDGVRAVVLEFATREISRGDWERVDLPSPRR